MNMKTKKNKLKPKIFISLVEGNEKEREEIVEKAKSLGLPVKEFLLRRGLMK